MVLTDAEATRSAVIGAITHAAQTLQYDDLFVLHYSGHGMNGRIDDPAADPVEVSSWILYDAPLASSELGQLWCSFARGVRILVISDSCHSGQAVRGLGLVATPAYRTRTLSHHDQQQVAANCRSIFRDRGPIAESIPAAPVVLLAGCQVDQESLDTEDAHGTPHGLFTAAILATIGTKYPTVFTARGDYEDFFRAVAAQTGMQSRAMGHAQDPALYFYGAGGFEADLMRFLGQPPFIVA